MDNQRRLESGEYVQHAQRKIAAPRSGARSGARNQVTARRRLHAKAQQAAPPDPAPPTEYTKVNIEQADAVTHPCQIVCWAAAPGMHITGEAYIVLCVERGAVVILNCS